MPCFFRFEYCFFKMKTFLLEYRGNKFLFTKQKQTQILKLTLCHLKWWKSVGLTSKRAQWSSFFLSFFSSSTWHLHNTSFLRLQQILRPGLPASKIIGLPHYCILQNASFLIPNFVFSMGYRQIPQSALHCSWLRVLSTIIFCYSLPTLPSSIPFCSGSCSSHLSKSPFISLQFRHILFPQLHTTCFFKMENL